MRCLTRFGRAEFVRMPRDPSMCMRQRGVSPFLAWGDFHARSRFARSTTSEEKWGTTRSLDTSGYSQYTRWMLLRVAVTKY